MVKNWPNAVAHIDADYFYANCELARNPQLRGKPVMVFGRLDTCILAKTPEAKKMGIKTAIPSWEAKKLCPNGIYIKGDFRYYTLISRQMMKIFEEWSPEVEVYSASHAWCPRKTIWRRDSFSATNPSQNEAEACLLALNIAAPCPPRSVVLVNRERVFASLFHLSTLSFAFSQGCDCPGYVATSE